MKNELNWENHGLRCEVLITADKINLNEIHVIFYPVRDSAAVGDTSVVNDQGRRPSDLFFLFFSLLILHLLLRLLFIGR